MDSMPNKHHWSGLLQGACLAACLATVSGALRAQPAANAEPAIIPTVHPVLSPSSAIRLPLELRADEAAVWRKDIEQRMFLRGHVVMNVGYRKLSADQAAVFLTPSKEAGESTFDVAIYLSGHVSVAEGAAKEATTSTAPELLVTTRITGAAQLSGTTPAARSEEDNPVVKRGDELRTDLLTKPPPPVHIPRITITETEQALQRGWIARGSGNRIIAGPAEAIAIGPTGEGVPAGAGEATTGPATQRMRPQIFATGDSVEYKPAGQEGVTLVRGSFYLMRTTPDNKPPLQLRAQKAVLFHPQEGAATQPAGGAARAVTGAYLEGDVTLEYGNQTVRAERIYYDFTSDRAIMLDAMLSGVDDVRHVPINLRAAEIRQVARGEYAAKSVKFSTSDFYTPHYHIGASDAYLQDVTPRDEKGKEVGPATYAFTVKDATFNVRGMPIFYWPYFSGDTSKQEMPLRQIKIGNSRRYGLSIMTDWDIFGLFGQKEPPGVHASLSLDYFGKRGPGGGLDAHWKSDEGEGLLRSYIMEDQGTDRLGRDRQDIAVPDPGRGRIVARHRQALDENWTLSIEGAYISDPNFLEEFYPFEFESDKEPETALYLKRQQDTEAITFLGKWSLFDFTASADQVDDQYTTEKKPEVKYWRIGDSLLDVFTYYSESGAANVHQVFTNYDPLFGGLQPIFPTIPPGQTFRQFYLANGWTDQNVLRGDSRHELDMPLQIGDAKITPYVTGRVTAWDQEFPEPADSGSTTRLWGAAGVRGAMQFWRVYDDIHSTFWDVNRIRHIVEPQFNLFTAGADQNRGELQPFDRDVEGITDASGAQLTLQQKWQTRRGGEGHWRNVDWVVLNLSYTSFWNEPEASPFFPGDPRRGFLFPSRPELSLVQDSISGDLTWRVGETTRFIAEWSYNTDDARLEQLAEGIAIDHSPNLSYFIGNRYIQALGTDEWTVGVIYQLTRKYVVSVTESYDFYLNNNILSTVTLVRRMPRFNTGLSITFDANTDDTAFTFTMWPEGFPSFGIGSTGVMRGYNYSAP